MAHLSKQLRTMKKFIILLLALIPIISGAQEFKPLKPLEVPDYPGNVISINESSFPPTTYTASYAIMTRGISATLGVPGEFDIFFKVDDADNYDGMTARLWIGGEQYYKQVFFTSAGKIYIDILGLHIKHMAVSGLQAVDFLNNGNLVLAHHFNEIEQELWRRAAGELINTVEKFKIL